jgi:hypothetical protein
MRWQQTPKAMQRLLGQCHGEGIYVRPIRAIPILG